MASLCLKKDTIWPAEWRNLCLEVSSRQLSINQEGSRNLERLKIWRPTNPGQQGCGQDQNQDQQEEKLSDWHSQRSVPPKASRELHQSSCSGEVGPSAFDLRDVRSRVTGPERKRRLGENWHVLSPLLNSQTLGSRLIPLRSQETEDSSPERNCTASLSFYFIFKPF